jgi:hypothetical protein
LQIVWTGAKYAVTDQLDVIAAYYQYIQNSFFGTAARGPAPCSGAEHPQCSGTFYAISAAVDWRFAPKWDLYAAFMFSQVNSGLANNFLQRNNIDPTVGLRFRFQKPQRPIAGAVDASAMTSAAGPPLSGDSRAHIKNETPKKAAETGGRNGASIAKFRTRKPAQIWKPRGTARFLNGLHM